MSVLLEGILMSDSISFEGEVAGFWQIERYIAPNIAVTYELLNQTEEPYCWQNMSVEIDFQVDHYAPKEVCGWLAHSIMGGNIGWILGLDREEQNISNPDVAFFSVGDGKRWHYLFSKPIDLTKHHTVKAVVQTTNMSLYVDGILENFTTLNSTFLCPYKNTLLVGYNYNGGRNEINHFINGYIGNLTIEEGTK
jgi:hypothetical protein